MHTLLKSYQHFICQFNDSLISSFYVSFYEAKVSVDLCSDVMYMGVPV